MPYQDDGKGGDFIHVSEGEHDAVIYGWEDRGLIEDEWQGKKKETAKAWVKFEVLDERLPDDPERFKDSSGKRLTFWHSVNIAFAPNANLTKLRAKILGLNPNDKDARGFFDENDFLGIRCKVVIEHNQNGWPKLVSIRKHEDQNYPDLENEFQVTGPPEEDPSGVNKPTPMYVPPENGANKTNGAQTNGSAPSKPAAPAKPGAPKPPVTPGGPRPTVSPQMRQYFNALVDACVANDLCDNGPEQIQWAAGVQDVTALKEQIGAFEDALKGAGIELPESGVHPASTGDDDLPF